jgi:transglutaminase-like putative cysteine protease
MNFKKDQTRIFVGVALVVIALMMAQPSQPVVKTVAGSWDISEEVAEAGHEQLLVEAVDFDYSHPDVFAQAKVLKEGSSSAYDSVKDTAKYVVENVQYSSKITIQYCYEEKASTVLQNKQGDCVSMSRLVTALLRAQGVPARTVGGCLSLRERCSALFTISPLFEAKVTEMEAGDFKKRGFLHEWVEAWTPEKGWVLIEATSGQVFPLNCGSYIQYGYDYDKYSRCVITDSSFWNTCRGA